MDTMRDHEKVYVVLGNEMQEEEGLLTLSWVINKFGSHQPISIVLIYIVSKPSMDFVLTPFGKVPASVVSDDKLQIISKCEQAKIDGMLTKFVAFCGKVKTEIHKIDKPDEPIEKTIVDFIMEFRITKLVIGMTSMRTSSRRSKSPINGSFYLHRNKPESCELYILYRGKLMILKEANEEEGHMEDEQGVIVARLRQRASFKGWLGKMLSHGHGKAPICPSPGPSTMSVDSDSPVCRNQWENYEQEIDEYFQELVVLGSKSKSEEDRDNGEGNGSVVNIPTEQDIPADSFQDTGDRIEDLKNEIQATNNLTELNKTKAKAEVDRQTKASWAICLCNHRAEVLEAQVAKEITTRVDLNKELDTAKEQFYEILTDVQESKNRLRSLLELQSELSSKLQVASLAKMGAEARIESAACKRVEQVREIEELRRQRDVFQRRVEFCKEKDAIAMVARMSGNQASCSGCREFSADEIRLATDGFGDQRKLRSGGDWSSVYRGRINSASVAVKLVDLSPEDFEAKVNLLGKIRHPHITALIGFCSELNCLIFEYMHNGCLRDILFSRRKGRTLQWHHRIQIAAQIGLGLGFLHQDQPRPIVHNGLNPSSIFLDRNFVAKIHSFGLRTSSDGGVQADVGSFGDLLLQLLTGRNWAKLDQEPMMMSKRAVLEALDDNAGDWPLDLAEEVVGLTLKCRAARSEPNNAGVVLSSVTQELNDLKKKADNLIGRKEYHMGSEDGFGSGDESSYVPSVFLCPVFRVLMENPHIAADGYSYEFEAIEDWLRMGHDTSPVTNLKLKHKHLTPNKTLRSLIQDWRNNSNH